MNICLDSDVLIDFLRGDKKGLDVLSDFESNDLAITSINSFEIFKGLRNTKISREDIVEFLSYFKVLSFDHECSEKAAEIFNYLRDKGEIIELTDIMIASICIVKRCQLATNNKKHFEKIPGVSLF